MIGGWRIKPWYAISCLLAASSLLAAHSPEGHGAFNMGVQQREQRAGAANVFGRDGHFAHAAPVWLADGGLFGMATGAQAAPGAPKSIYMVCNTNDSGAGSLRQAIIDANNHAGADDIEFDIPESDPGYTCPSFCWWTITPLSSLPSLSDNGTTINGYTQTRTHGDDNPAGPEVVVDGSSLGGSMNIFTIEGDNNEIIGLNIANGPGNGIAIITGASGNLVQDNYIGTNPTGIFANGNDNGVSITSGSNNNTIDHNIISGNDTNGVFISGSGSDQNKLWRNFIGLDASGQAKTPNGGDGVRITSQAQKNEIGDEVEDRNYISGNGHYGVFVSGAGSDENQLKYNYIGINYFGGGSPDVGNGYDGVRIEGGAVGAYLYFNVISGNHQHGIYIGGSGTQYNTLSGNVVGGNPDGTAVIPNWLHGVAIYDFASDNDLGNLYNPSIGNVILGNGWSGVAIQNSDENQLFYNFIGISPNSSAASLGNQFYGVAIDGGSENLLQKNTIANNGRNSPRDGVYVQGATALKNTIIENSIYDNSAKGIALVDGGNGGIFTPTISSASCTQVSGSACTGCKVEIFSDVNGEGRIYEGWVSANSITPAFSWSGSVTGPNVTVTMTKISATYLPEETSEFSLPFIGACFQVYLPLAMK